MIRFGWPVTHRHVGHVHVKIVPDVKLFNSRWQLLASRFQPELAYPSGYTDDFAGSRIGLPWVITDRSGYWRGT